MTKIDKNLKKTYGSNISKRGAFLVMQLHDELIYEVNKSDVTEVSEIIRTGMENCMEFAVNMKVKIRIGNTWGNLDKYEVSN